MSALGAFAELRSARLKRRTKGGLFALLALGGGIIGGRLGRSDEPVRTSEVEIPITPSDNLQNVTSAGSSTGDLTTTAVAPIRIVDTRPKSFTYGGVKVPWGAQETRSVQAAGLATIPPDAVGVVVNITALNATADDTFLTVFPSGSLRPEASTLNPVPGEIAFNGATVLLNNGAFDIYNYSGTVDVIIDVTAYLTENLARDVASLENLTVVLRDANGIRYPTIWDGESFAVRIVDRWVKYGSDGLKVDRDFYYTSSDCSGSAYSAVTPSLLQTELSGGLLAQGHLAQLSQSGPIGFLSLEGNSTLDTSSMQSVQLNFRFTFNGITYPVGHCFSRPAVAGLPLVGTAFSTVRSFYRAQLELPSVSLPSAPLSLEVVNG